MITFRPNCTFPSQAPVFVSATNIRPTLDIAWSCVSVLILSSWSILHLSVPQQFNPQTKRQKWRLKRDNFLRKVKWMFITLMAPELIFAKAACDAWSAYQKTPHLMDFAEEDGVTWTTAHTRFADLGGFVIRFSHLSADPIPENQDEGHMPRRIANDHAKFHARLRELSALYGPTTWKPLPEHKLPCLKYFRSHTYTSSKRQLTFMGDIWAVSAAELGQARKIGLIASLPQLTEMELADKSKGDIFIKALALFQFIWLAMQVSSRWALNKPASPLEVMAFAFATCAFFIYLTLLDSPQDVTTPIHVEACRVATESDMREMSRFESIHLDGAVIGSSLRRMGRIASDVVHSEWPSATPGTRRAFTVDARVLYLGTVTIAALLFGGLHLIAWNSFFPNDVEQALWRVASLITMLQPLLVVLGLVGIRTISDWLDISEGVEGVQAVFTVFMMVALVLARVFLVVEAFRSLYYLPPTAYENTWAASVPHIG